MLGRPMTILHIQIMLWYYCRPVRYGMGEPEHANSPAVREYTKNLVDWGMIEPVEATDYYKATDRGIAYVEYLRGVPLPRQMWEVHNGDR